MAETILFILLAFAALGIACAVWISRSRPLAADPFAQPFGDVAQLPPGSVLECEAERSRAEQGVGFSARELQRFAPHVSAQPATCADQGSGGDGSILSRAAAARSYRGRERRAF